MRWPMDLAPYAVRESRGRRHPEPAITDRSPYQRDRDRVLHSAAFRKLQYKTQVFVSREGDFYRTRLTHSLEVAQIARSIARRLRLDEDLTEALALAHDLGHPPFGHAGEAGLNEALVSHGGFDHNAQSLRVVTLLEHRYAAFDGLNLSWEALEGLAKHNGPFTGRAPDYIAAFDAEYPLELARQPSAEAQVAALADDIAYNAHDLDDGLRAKLFSLDEILGLPLVGPALAEARGLSSEESRVRHETIRRVIGAMIQDVIGESRARLERLAPRDVEAIRDAGPVIGFSEKMGLVNQAVKKFLFEKMYRHWRVNRMTHKARLVTAKLAELLLSRPDLLPDDWRDRAGAPDSGQAAGIVRDYVAGMTDRYAMEEFARLTDPSVPA